LFAAGPAVTGLALVDADTDADAGPLLDGGTIDLSATPHVSLRADTSPAAVGSVVFALDGVKLHAENAAPYAVVGNDGGDYLPWSIQPGGHTLTVTPFTAMNCTGTAGQALTIHFTAAVGGLTAAPAPPANLGGSAIELPTAADAYGRDGTYANTNFGTTPTLEVKTVGAAGYTRQSFSAV